MSYQDGEVGEYELHLPPVNTSKLHLYVEQLSWGKNENGKTPIQSKLQERFTCN